MKTIATTCQIPNINRSSRPDVFFKKGVLKNFTKLTGKHLCQSLFFNKVTGLTPATLLEKRRWHSYFPVNFVKFLRTPFPIGHLWLLLLDVAVCGYYVMDKLLQNLRPQKIDFTSSCVKLIFFLTEL